MAGYSPTPTVKKLGLKSGGVLALVDQPPGWDVEGRPAEVARVGADHLTPRCADGGVVVVAFHRAASELGPSMERLAPLIYPDGALWAAWPRRAGGHSSDITDNSVRDAALPLGLVDVKVAAIDDDWSGLRLVWRKELRGPRARSPGVDACAPRPPRNP